EFENVALYCKVGGVPSPSVHWLKNGKRIVQVEELNGFGDDKLSMYDTGATLFIDCLDETDQANYTCVAETPKHRESRSIFLTVLTTVVLSLPGRPARIYMGTNSVLELENNSVRLFCRAQGNPAPSITWYDRDNQVIQDGGHYRLSKSGDLIIKNISWFDHMGVYTCEAKNDYGADTSSPFLYPTARE
ncbi:hypothetical protein EGW08_000816, partial [Elysia chlorotica]